MSVRIMGAIWGLELEPTTAHILLALADHADHNGHHARPGVDLLKWKTGYSDRQVRRVLAELIDMGVLVPTAGVGGGRGKHTEYSIVLDHVPNRTEPGPRRNTDKKTANRAGFQGQTNPATLAGFPDINPAIHDTETLPSTTQNPAIHDSTYTETPFKRTVKEPSKRTVNTYARANELTPAEKALPEATKAALRERRDDLFRAYCRGVGIKEQSAEYAVALNFVSGHLTPEVVAVLDPEKFEAMARYTAESWRAAGIRKTPKIPKVLEEESEFDRWLEDGRPPHGAPSPSQRAANRADGRRGMGNDYLAKLARGEK